MKKWEKPMIQELGLKNTAIDASAQFICCKCGTKYPDNRPGTQSVPEPTYTIKPDGKCGGPYYNPGNQIVPSKQCNEDLVSVSSGLCS